MSGGVFQKTVVAYVVHVLSGLLAIWAWTGWTGSLWPMLWVALGASAMFCILAFAVGIFIGLAK
jgi:hypothetical protein